MFKGKVSAPAALIFARIGPETRLRGEVGAACPQTTPTWWTISDKLLSECLSYLPR